MCYIVNNQAVLIINNISIRYNGQYKVQVWDIVNQTNQSFIRIHIYSLGIKFRKCDLFNFSLFYLVPLIMYCYNGTLERELYNYILCRFKAKHPQIQW